MAETRSAQELITEAERIADQVLFPQALDADLAGTVPESQLQHLADAGFMAISTTSEPTTIAAVIERLASGCLTTAFVWAQHMGATAAAHTTEGPAKAELAEDLKTGRKRGGVAFAHLLRPGTPMTTARPTADGWLYSGSAPWVTGWGYVDVVHVAARHGDDMVWALIDAVESPTLASTDTRFAVVDSTQTRELEFTDHFAPDARITSIRNFEDWKSTYRLGMRSNGSFALGVANRCCRLLEDPALSARLDQVRATLDETDPADEHAMSAARADASLFAVTVATALVAKAGGRGVLLDNHAQRLMREAMFVLVQGQTPTIKAKMLDRLK